VKLLNLRNSAFRANWSHDNDGDGLWIDTNGINVRVEENVFESNTRWGFFYEASYAATVRNNVFADNGVVGPFGGWGFERGGIIISTSKDVDIGNNLLYLNHSYSLRYRWDNRGSGTAGTFELVNNQFHDNEVRFNSERDAGSRAEIVSVRDTKRTVSELATNTFDDNTYRTSDLIKSWWFWPSASYKDFSRWQTALGHDPNGSHEALG
jgi:parallel beta-helix repeat protein